MKNVFLISMLFVAFVTQINAQNCSVPCTPGCCIKACSAKGSAAVSADDQSIPSAFAAFLLAATESTGQSENIEQYQSTVGTYVKATPSHCKAVCTPSPKCQSGSSAVTNDQNTGATFASFLISGTETLPESQDSMRTGTNAYHPSCQPACQSKSAAVSKCQGSASAVAVAPSVSSTRLKQKS